MPLNDREAYIARCMASGMDRSQAEEFAEDATEADLIFSRIMALANNLRARDAAIEEVLAATGLDP
jgi:hypothetical protein